MKKTILFALFFFFSFTLLQAQCTLLPNAVPGISLTHQNTNCFNNSGVAYNPQLNLYYGVRAGNPSFPLETWTSTGTPLYNTSAGFDWRGMWWNPTTNQLEGNGYYTYGVWKADLDVNGYAQNTGVNIFTGQNQPDAQSCGDLDWQAYEIIYYNNGSIYRYSRATNAFIGSYPLTGIPVALSNLNWTTVMYTGCGGMEIALLDYVLKRIYLFKKNTGNYVGMCQLPAGAVTTDAFRTSWANCAVWLFDLSTYTWFSYKIFNSCGGCTTQYAIQGISICSSDSTWVGGGWQNTTGVYYDTLTAMNGCDSIMITNLTVHPTLTTNLNISICPGDSVFAGGAYQTTPGTYYDTLAAATSCDSVIVSNISLLATTSVTLNINICPGDSAYAGGAYQTSPGTYYDTLSGVNSCDSIVISHLSLLSNSSSTQIIFICNGDSVFAGGNYQTSAGIYYDTLAAANGCDSIVVSNLSVLPNSSSAQSLSICSGDSALLGGSYQTAPGVYYDTLTSANGCDSIRATTLSLMPGPDANISGTASICSGDTAVLTATGGTSYAWSTGQTTTIISVNPVITSIYWVTANNNCGADDTSFQVTVLPLPVSLPGFDTTIKQGTPIDLEASGGSTYLWSNGATTSTITVAPESPATFTVTITDNNNCSDVITFIVSIEVDNVLYLPNIFSPNGDGVNDILKVRGSGIQGFTLQIFDRWGERLFATSDLSTGWDGTVNGKSADQGVYVYTLKGNFYNGDEFDKKGNITLIR